MIGDIMLRINYIESGESETALIVRDLVNPIDAGGREFM